MIIDELKEILINEKNKLKNKAGISSNQKLKESLDTITHLTEKAEKNKNKFNVNESIQRVVENYLLIEKEGKILLGEKNRPTNRLLIFADIIVKRAKIVINRDVIKCFYETLCGDSYLTDNEIGAIPLALKESYINYLAESKWLVPADVSNAVNSLRQLSFFDFSPFFSAFERVERILRADPAGVYPRTDRQTRDYYRRVLFNRAKKAGTSPLELLNKYNDEANRSCVGSKEHSICHYLVERTRTKEYFFTLFSLFILLYVASVLFISSNQNIILSIIICLFLALPVSETSKYITDIIFSKICSPRIIPKIDINAVTEKEKTLVAIAGILSSKEEGKRLAQKLEKYYNATKADLDGEINYALMCDLPEASVKVTKNDDKNITSAIDQIERLNTKYGPRFYLFVRRRSFSKTENKYICRERKRGSVCDTVSLLKGKDTHSKVYFGDLKRLKNTKYLITLDSDTQISLMSVKHMIGAMVHPDNAPIIERKNGVSRVISGYGIMQPNMRSTLSSAYKSPFSNLITFDPGFNLYENASYETFGTVFNEGIFCGKGIIDIDAFYETCVGVFPKERILSHDIAEGGRLHCGALTDVSLSDSVPTNVLSYYIRAERWARGDTQSLPLLKNHIKNRKGKKAENPQSGLTKYCIFDNFRKLFVPYCAIRVIFFCAFIDALQGNIAVAIALSFLWVPFLYSTFTALKAKRKAFFYRNFFTLTITSLKRNTYTLLYNLASLALVSGRNFYSIVKSLYRMAFSGKNLLNWITASDGDKKKGDLLTYFKFCLTSFFTGIITIGLSKNVFTFLLSASWIFFFYIAYLISLPYENKKVILSDDKNILMRWAKDIFKYFDNEVAVSENSLPPDNIQISPQKRAARTSPTNIGLYLLSLLGARDMGFITTGILYSRIKATMDTVSSLGKWNGHLYNWYDCVTGRILGTPYVSTVDSGNFIVSLIALSEGLSEYVSEEVRLLDEIQRINKLCENTDFKPLYSRERKLFYIGIDVSTGIPSSSYYDLYMSESRLTSYYCVAKGIVPKAHFGTLGRTLIERKGYLGVASWSGTAFEYYMPTLLLPNPENSFSAEGLKFAWESEKRYTAVINKDRVFGISESAIFSFDRDMNYQYRANGVPSLAIRKDFPLSKVISPYSTFLMLQASPRSAIENLKRLEKNKVYGKYGFYEAVDFSSDIGTDGPGIVKSYMSHHMGMSFISIINMLKDNIFVKRFMSNPQMAAAEELLHERIPIDDPVISVKNTTGNQPPKTVRNEVTSGWESSKKQDSGYLLNGKNTFMKATSSGLLSLNARAISDSILISKDFSFTNDYNKSVHPFVITDEKCLSPINTLSLLEYKTGKNYITYRMPVENDSVTITCASIRDQSAFLFSYKGKGHFSYGLYFEPILREGRAYIGHPAYNSLFIEAFFDSENNALLFHNKKNDGDNDIWIAVAGSSNAQFFYETRKDQIFKDGFSIDALNKYMKDEYPNEKPNSPPIDPVCFIKSTVSEKSGEIIIAAEKTREAALLVLSNVRGMIEFDSDVNKLLADKTYQKTETELLRSLFFKLPKPMMPFPSSFDRRELWKYGISGDLPIAVIFIDESFYEKLTDNSEMITIFKDYIKNFRRHIIAGYKYDLVFLLPGGNVGETLRGIFYRLITKLDASFLFSSIGSLFLINCETKEEYNLFNLSSSFFDSTIIKNAPKSNNKRALFNPKTALPVPGLYFNSNNYSNLIETNGGAFTNSGFLINRELYNPIRPWSHILANNYFGTMVTTRSLGFTYYSNSALKRLSAYTNDPYDESGLEKLYIKDENGIYYDLCLSAGRIYFGENKVEYFGSVTNIDYKITVEIKGKLPIKNVSVSLFSNIERHLELVYSLKPILGYEERENMYVLYKEEENRILFSNTKANNMNIYGGVGFLSCSSAPLSFSRSLTEDIYENSLNASAKIQLYGTENRSITFSLGFAYTKKALENIPKLYVSTDKLSYIQGAKTSSAITPLYGFWLKYQTLMGRMFARTGFYQPGGAYGFRDQLQDCLLIMKDNPSIVRTHIIRAAAHQFEEGDVQHWWHNLKNPYSENVANIGVRTLCSDDLLWLPYVLTQYINKTGDKSILNVEVPFLVEPVLAPDEKERYSLPRKGKEKYSILEHAMRVVRLVIKRGVGVHGLALMGSGDWNDGMNAIGIKGMGESVWLSFFIRLVFSEFSEFAGEKERKEMITFSEKLSYAIEENAFRDGYYIRAFTDGGEPVGSSNNTSCKIDVLPQAFSAICAEKCGGNLSRAKSAMSHAINNLYDKKNNLLLLFSPPFKEKNEKIGYISDYIAGVRENGGQYTHGAVFCVLGLLSLYRTTKITEYLELAEKLLNALDPSKRNPDVYLNEPYVLSGDVYNAEGAVGRGGWSWYTGSAAWYGYAIEEFTKIQAEKNKK